MAGKDFDRQEKGQPIKATTLNGPIAEVERLSRLSVAGGMTLQSGPGGPAIAGQEVQEIWGKITSGSGLGPYAWTEQRAGATPGTWVDGYLAGTTSADPAYNTVDFTPSLPIVVPMRRDDGGTWRFTAGSC